MYTIDDLADELNRKTWAVEKMLENRGYLKQNGDPRKSTINEGLMDEDGMITDDGWSTFIDELGYKGAGSDDDDDDNDESEEEDEDDGDDAEEPDEDEIRNIIRNELDNPDEEIVDALYDFFDRVYNEDSDDEKDVEASLDCVRDYYSYIQDCFNEGHTLAYVVAMISSIPDEDQAYMEMDEGDMLEDLESVFVARGFSDAAIEFMRSEFDSCFEACRPDDFISGIEIYDEAYNKALDHYGDEEKARSFAESCYHGGKVADLDDDVDDFEEYLSEGEPWVSDGEEGPFVMNPTRDYYAERTEYFADDILSYYYENPDQKPSYTRSDPEFVMGCWTFTSKSYYDLVDEEDGFGDDEDDNEEDDNGESWEPTEDYPTKESWEDDQDSLMFPNGHDDGE